MAIKKTLIQIVQEILSDMDSEDVTSVTDTLEAEQVARIVESTFYNIISTREVKEHYELIKLTALSDSDYPSHFSLPTNLRRVDKLWYNTDEDGGVEYTKVRWIEPLDFVLRTDGLTSDYDTVLDKNGSTTLKIQNNKMPEYFTSFDDYYVVLDSYKSGIDSTLQESKIRAYGSVYPSFDRNDDNYIPDIDGDMFPYLIAEAKSTCFSVLKGGVDQKIEQAARRQKSFIQNDKYRIQRANNWSNYGR